ncbi:hypothetical protein OROHE_027023 [Orobanche hederae]
MELARKSNKVDLILFVFVGHGGRYPDESGTKSTKHVEFLAAAEGTTLTGIMLKKVVEVVPEGVTLSYVTKNMSIRPALLQFSAMNTNVTPSGTASATFFNMIPVNVVPSAAARNSTCLVLLEVSRNFLPSPNSFSHSYKRYTRGFQSIPEASMQPVNNQVEHEICTFSTNPGTSVSASNSEDNQTTSSSIKHQVSSNLKVSERHDLAMIFTCRVCDTRSVKTVCRESYDKGVVVARCDGCNNLHLIADRLGWFGEPGSVEEFLSARGEEVKKGSVDSLNLTLEDLAGKEKV